MTVHVYDLTHTLSVDLREPAEAARAWDACHAVATLQGVVNRTRPRLYVRFVECDGRNVDDFWLEHLTASERWLAGAAVERVDTLERLVGAFRGDIDGVVLYDATLAPTSNLASSFAGVEDLIAVRRDETHDSVYERLVLRPDGPGLPVKRDLTDPALREQFLAAARRAESRDEAAPVSLKAGVVDWGREQLIDSGRCASDALGYYIDAYWINHAHHSVPNHHTLTNHDYFVSRRAFFCDLNCWADEQPIDEPDQPLGADAGALRRVLHSLYRRDPDRFTHVGGFTPWAFKYTDLPHCGGKRHGVETEWELIRLASAYNAFIDADAIGYGAMANASFFQHFPLEARYRQSATPKHETLSSDRGSSDSDHDYVMYYVGDYDSAAWLYQRMPELWNDAARGDVPLSWAISPILAVRAPHVLAHLYATQTDNDAFIAGDNGAGYLNPSMLSEPRPISGLPDGLSAWERHCTPYYERWDKRISGFVINGRAAPPNEAVLAAYARFSPDGIVLQTMPGDPPAKVGEQASQRYRLQQMCLIDGPSGGTPVLRAGPDINHDDPAEAADALSAQVAERRANGLRFHWVRSVLKSPSWYADVTRRVTAADTRVRVLTAPTFFGLLRARLVSGASPRAD